MTTVRYQGSTQYVAYVNNATSLAGSDHIRISAGWAQQVYGHNGNDLIDGNTNHDTVWAGAGNDTINGLAGDDFILGETGNDTVYGGAGYDQIWGGDNDDRIFGDAGNDRLYGGSGADTVSGGADNDVVQGYDGNDILYGEAAGVSGMGTNSLYGGGGDDKLYGGGGVDYLVGDIGNDDLTGGGSADSVRAGDGDDILRGGDGYDLLYGDGGSDTFIIATGTSRTDVFDTAGVSDILQLSNLAVADIQLAQVGNDLWVSTAADFADGVLNYGVALIDWYINADKVEYLRDSSGALYLL